MPLAIQPACPCIRCIEAFGYNRADTKSIFAGRLRILPAHVTIGQFPPNYLSQRAKRIVALAGRPAAGFVCIEADASAWLVLICQAHNLPEEMVWIVVDH